MGWLPSPNMTIPRGFWSSTVSLRQFSLLAIILQFPAASLQSVDVFEPTSNIAHDHNHPFRPLLERSPFSGHPDVTPSDVDLLRRAEFETTTLSNNAPQDINIEAGQVQNWVFLKEDIEGRPGERGSGLPSDEDEDDGSRGSSVRELKKRQNSKKVYITLNTCSQPTVNTTGSAADSGDDDQPPQLQLWISTSSTLTQPGPGSTADDSRQQQIDFDGGYASFETGTSEDIYVAVSAPNISTVDGVWNYEIAASIDAPYHSIGEDATSLFFVDGDNQAALLVTSDTTQKPSSSEISQKWMSLDPAPYGVFAHNRNDSTNILGLQNSFCGLKAQAQIAANIPRARGTSPQNTASMVKRGGMGGKPKVEFYITNLNASSNYWGFLAMDGNSTASGSGVIGGGGTIWKKAIKFATKTEGNCALLHNLTFCSEVAYAVPSNPELLDSDSTGESISSSSLARLYDTHAADLYRNFNYSLQQVPCQAPPLQQYSLVRNCSDCANAYKTWLCAVTIPRCEDFGLRKSYLLERNVGANFLNGSSPFEPAGEDKSDRSFNGLYDRTWLSSKARNSSRNPLIDEEIRPGPYKEVLPCRDLCYDLIQSCPASLGFSCPLSGKGLDLSYGSKDGGGKGDDDGRGDEDERNEDRWDGEVRCSYPGAVHFTSPAPITGVKHRRSERLPAHVLMAIATMVVNLWLLI